jgi:alkanesulfonate monooxygenase SsuD/methylene tetrahydromethanopterin reductase-like flavin-dependent oxidoreductase (luciferase family)
MVVTSDAEFETARAGLTYRLIDSPERSKNVLDSTPGRVAAIRLALSEGGPARAAPLIEDDWIPQFMIAGTPTECAERLLSLADQGIDEFQLPVLDPAVGAELIDRVASYF